jgi:hypothetical protein
MFGVTRGGRWSAYTSIVFFLGLFALLFHLFDVLTFTMCLLYARNFFGAFPSACMEDGPIKHNDIVFQDTLVNLYFVQVFLIIFHYICHSYDNCFSTKTTTVVPMNFSKGMKYLSIYSANYSPLFLSNKILQFVRKKGGLGLKRTF